MAGAPKGNNNAGIGREARHALELALEHWGMENPPEVIGRIKTLIMMWKPIIEKAMVEGDLAAMKEINDRLDGRPHQSVMLTGDEDSPISIRRVERVIVKPKNTDS